MAPLPSAIIPWLENNWFSLCQSIGIIAGLLFTALTIWRDAKTRRRGDVLALAQQHHELWSEFYRRPDFARILQPDVDLVGKPVTFEEGEFLNLVIVHFNTGWVLAMDGVVLNRKTLRIDIQSFFTLPLPRAVWEQSKASRDPQFVKFVEQCLRGH